MSQEILQMSRNAASSHTRRPAPNMSQQISLAPRGARKMNFSGRELAMSMSYAPERSFWHEVNVYLRDRGGIVIAVRSFFCAPDIGDFIRAWRADSVAEAMEKLDAFDAGEDVPESVDPDTPGLCPAEMTAAALHLRAQVASARQSFDEVRADIHDQLDALGLT
jgi:hypothetical protein